MKDLNDTKTIMETKALRLRSCANLASSTHFEKLWVDAPDKTKKTLTAMLLDGDKPGLLKWIKEQRSKKLEDMNLRELLSKAKAMLVSNYSRLTRSQLIEEIREVERFYAKHRDPRFQEPDATTTSKTGSESTGAG